MTDTSLELSGKPDPLREHSDLLSEEFFSSVELTSARLLGRDVGLLLTNQSQRAVLEISEDQTALAAGMAAGIIEIDEAFERVVQLLEMLGQGMMDVLNE